MSDKNLPNRKLFKKELNVLMAEGRPKITHIARHFGMPVRTMQRRLQEAGLTYSELVDEVRYDAACRKLKACRTSVGAIANELGFTDASNFSRAFQRWSGMSPSTYRNKHRFSLNKSAAGMSGTTRGEHTDSRSSENVKHKAGVII